MLELLLASSKTTPQSIC